jgi:hypothetical protein
VLERLQEEARVNYSYDLVTNVIRQIRNQEKSSTMSDLPKLHYFPIAGRAEPIRLACAIGGVKYEGFCRGTANL